MFKPVTIGRLQLEHKVVLAPLTRMRATKEADGVFYPGDLNVEYYSQRASKGGFMLTEACPINRLVRGVNSITQSTTDIVFRPLDTRVFLASSHKHRSTAGKG